MKDHNVIHSPTCGEIREILTADDCGFLNIAIALDIKPTQAHYHEGFEEIYFVLDGNIDLKLYNPKTKKIWTGSLTTNELCVISKGMHHRIVESSDNNRLCAISVPHFDPLDEHLSDRI